MKLRETKWGLALSNAHDTTINRITEMTNWHKRLRIITIALNCVYSVFSVGKTAKKAIVMIFKCDNDCINYVVLIILIIVILCSLQRLFFLKRKTAFSNINSIAKIISKMLYIK